MEDNFEKQREILKELYKKYNNGNFLEIGGPSLLETERDMKNFEPSKITFLNPSLISFGGKIIEEGNYSNPRNPYYVTPDETMDKKKEFIRSTVEDANLKDDEYDVITSYSVFGVNTKEEQEFNPHGIDIRTDKQKRLVLEKISKTLKKGGLLKISIDPANKRNFESIGFPKELLEEYGFKYHSEYFENDLTFHFIKGNN